MPLYNQAHYNYTTIFTSLNNAPSSPGHRYSCRTSAVVDSSASSSSSDVELTAMEVFLLLLLALVSTASHVSGSVHPIAALLVSDTGLASDARLRPFPGGRHSVAVQRSRVVGERDVFGCSGTCTRSVHLNLSPAYCFNPRIQPR